MRSMYPIHSIFSSWQAEGYLAGRPTIFVRFSGCNFKCSWCDTDFSLKEKLRAAEIAGRISALAAHERATSVCFTGGEPCMHDLDYLMDEIQNWFDSRVSFQIETNGTMKHERFIPRAFVTVSPKKPDGSPVEGGEWTCHQLKLVYQGQDLQRFYCSYRDHDTQYIRPGWLYVQPLYIPAGPDGYPAASMNWRECLEAARCAPNWRLSFQTNKWVGAE